MIDDCNLISDSILQFRDFEFISQIASQHTGKHQDLLSVLFYAKFYFFFLFMLSYRLEK